MTAIDRYFRLPHFRKKRTPLFNADMRPCKSLCMLPGFPAPCRLAC